MSQDASAASPQLHDTSEAFQLVQDLASQLSTGELRLPSLPEVVLRIRKTLQNPEFDVEELARHLGTEPVLAGSVLKLANSVTYRRNAAETASLTAAIARIGASMVRSASMNFAMQQLQAAKQFRHLEPLLKPEWRRSKLVAGLCHSLARRTRRANPDELLMIGLVHNVGRIFILSHAEHYPMTFSNPAVLEDLMAHWHPTIGGAIADSWGLPAAGMHAIAQQCTPDEQQDHRHPVTDILQIAVGLERLPPEEPEALDALAATPEPTRLGLDPAALDEARRDGTEWVDLLS